MTTYQTAAAAAQNVARFQAEQVKQADLARERREMARRKA